MTNIEEIAKKISTSIKDVEVQAIDSKNIRINVEPSLSVRIQKTAEVMALFKDSKTTPQRPHDVVLPSGIKLLVKPGIKKKSSSSHAGPYYGRLETLNLKEYNLSDFSSITPEFALGSLPRNIKEKSDVIVVSDINKEIEKNIKSPTGITLKLGGYTFENVLGCIPVTKGEPKADVIFVCLNYKTRSLYADAFLSYKMGTKAKDFQNYSGLSEKSSPYIFTHPETINFYNTLYSLNQSNIKEDVFQEIKDRKIIGLSVWGSDFGTSRYNINNCHVIAQGKAKIMGSVLDFDHIQKNGDFNFDKSYSPVFGARYATGRSNKGPKGLKVDNFRIGIFPRAYRARWLK